MLMQASDIATIAPGTLSMEHEFTRNGHSEPTLVLAAFNHIEGAVEILVLQRSLIESWLITPNNAHELELLKKF